MRVLGLKDSWQNAARSFEAANQVEQKLTTAGACP